MVQEGVLLLSKSLPSKVAMEFGCRKLIIFPYMGHVWNNAVQFCLCTMQFKAVSISHPILGWTAAFDYQHPSQVRTRWSSGGVRWLKILPWAMAGLVQSNYVI